MFLLDINLTDSKEKNTLRAFSFRSLGRIVLYVALGEIKSEQGAVFVCSDKVVEGNFV